MTVDNKFDIIYLKRKILRAQEMVKDDRGIEFLAVSVGTIENLFDQFLGVNSEESTDDKHQNRKDIEDLFKSITLEEVDAMNKKAGK